MPKKKGERADEVGSSSEVTSDITGCLQAWRQAGYVPADMQKVAERALKLGRGSQAVTGASSGASNPFPKSIVFLKMSAATVLNIAPRFMSIRMNSSRQSSLFVLSSEVPSRSTPMTHSPWVLLSPRRLTSFRWASPPRIEMAQRPRAQGGGALPPWFVS